MNEKAKAHYGAIAPREIIVIIIIIIIVVVVVVVVVPAPWNIFFLE